MLSELSKLSPKFFEILPDKFITTVVPIGGKMIKQFDKRINAWNVVSTISVRAYMDLAKAIITNNDYQRKRVRSSASVYNLLKVDLQKGCIIPPIVLAISKEDFNDYLVSDEKLIEYLIENKSHVLILDGLQRTFTLRDLVNELTIANDPELESVLKREIRIEVYLGIDRLGILYRMLTLNSGQTPMSSRHQIEIIYADFAKHPINDIKLLKEVDDTAIAAPNEYKFSDVIDGFTSYMERDYLSIDRIDILDNIKSLEKFSYENSPDIFENFINSYNEMVKFVRTNTENWTFDIEEYSLKGRPFSTTIEKLFAKSQALTGYGAAIGKLIDNSELTSVADVINLTKQIRKGNISEALDQLIINLDKVRTDAKKIGNDQRLYFHFFFRKLFSKSSETFLDMCASANEAFTHYERETK